MVCPFLSRYTESKDRRKLVTRHVWADDMEQVEEIRHTKGYKEIYNRRKETIERIFGTAKEFHGMRFTNQIGHEKMHVKVGLTLTCLNIKKLTKMMKNVSKIV